MTFLDGLSRLPARRRFGLAALALFAFTLLAHLPILANPGFYSHDEWEKLDYVRAHGLTGAVRAYAQVQAGAEFGHPVRPIGFIQQSISALWMEVAPFVPHLLDVLLHAVVATALLAALLDSGAGWRLALGAALLFSVSPLTTMATGWTAASFDQWYVLFSLLACWAAFRVAARGMTVARGVGLFASAACAILSKETALALPGAVVLVMAVAALSRERFHAVASAGALLIVALPLVAYLAMRAPALQASLAGSAAGYYAPSLANVAHNALAYFAFPFMPHASDFPAVSRYGSARMLAALSLHTLLVAGVAAYAGWRFAAIYLLAFFVFLAPVLPLPVLASHYLYGAAVPVALAIAVVLRGAWQRQHRFAMAAIVPGAALMLGNTAMIQGRLYLDGVCQATFLATLESRLAARDATSASAIVIVAEPGVRSWVARRAIHDRVPFRDAAGKQRVRFGEIPAAPTPDGADALQLHMNPRCLVR